MNSVLPAATVAKRPLVLGVSATPYRADGKPLGDVFDGIIFKLDTLSLIEAGHLSDLKAVRVRYQANFDALQVRRGDVTAESAAAAFLAGGGPAAVAVAIRHHAADRKAILVFTPTVETAFATADALNLAGIKAEVTWGEQPAAERQAVRERFMAGETRAVINCALWTEGVDVPCIDCVILARPTKSPVLFSQQIGRGLRLHPGKHDCLIIDLAGASKRHDLVNVPSFFGLPANALDQGASLLTAARREREQALRAKQTLVVPATPNQVTLKAHPVNLFPRRKVTPNWLRLPNGRLVLSMGEHVMGVLYQHGGYGGWSAAIRDKDGQRDLVRNAGLEHAKDVIEQYAYSVGADRLIDKHARWRNDPASDKQLAALRNRVPISPDLTKGGAFDLITLSQARRLAS